jgi:hypothetical protein
VIAVVVSVTIAALWWASAGRSRPPAPSTDAVRVGLAPGGSIPGYVESSRRELAAYTGGDSYALVSFDAYLPADRLASLLAGVDPAEVLIRVPLPDAQTEIVRLQVRRLPTDVYEGMDTVATRKEDEIAEYRRLMATVGDPASQESYAEGARVAAAEVDALRHRVACTYAAVVRGSRVALTTLAGRAGVRAVDPAPEVRDPARSVFLPPLPEQSDVARPPAGR